MLYPIIKKLTRIPNITRGGCGIATYVMYMKAKEIYPDKDIKIIYSYLYEGELEDNRPIIESNDLQGVHSPAHCYIKVDGDRFDVTDNEEWNYNIIEVQVDFLKKSIKNASWNPRFDRRYVKDIEKFSSVDLNFVEV